jgi:selenocysteine lyase/cysteine desulfurase
MKQLNRRELFRGLAGTAGALGLAEPTLARARNKEFMFEPGLIYLNTAALGPTPRPILERTLQAWYQLESDPVKMAYGDGPVHVATDNARKQLGGLINCTSDEILITRSATSAMNSLSLAVSLTKGDRILTTDVEHEGGTNGWFYLKKRAGIEVDIIPIAPTEYDVSAILKRFEQAITPQTRVLFVSHVISSTGLRMPVKEIAAMARRHGILSIIDGAQAAGCIDVNVTTIGCDAYAGTGHKWIMGPKGTGFAYINKDAASLIQPIELEQGKRFVSGSTGVGSLPLVIGLGEAAQAMKDRGMRSVEQRIVALRDRAYAGLKNTPQITLYSPPPGPLATALVSFRLPDKVDSREFRDRLLSKYKLVVKVVEKRWFNGTRLSPHIFNTEDDIDRAVAAIKKELA